MVTSKKALVHGPVIGRFMDKPIYEWVEDPYGARYGFVRVIMPYALGEDFEMEMGVDEGIIPPGLLYKKSVAIEAFLPASSSDHQFL